MKMQAREKAVVKALCPKWDSMVRRVKAFKREQKEAKK